MLENFGEKYFCYIDKIKNHISVSIDKQQIALASFDAKFINNKTARTWKTKFFDNENEVFFQEFKKIGERTFSIEKMKFDERTAMLDEILNKHNSKALAILIMNNVHLRDFLYIDLIELKKIYAQKDKVYLERFKLYPNHYPLTQKLKDHKKIYGKYIKKTI